MTKINCIVCLECGAILHSKHRHDWVSCDCPNGTFTDGGDDYFRTGGKDFNKIKRVDSLEEAKSVSLLVTERL